MELMAFIEHNWFPITFIISIIGFTIKMVKIVNDYAEKLKILTLEVSNLKSENTKKFEAINQRLDSNHIDREDEKERTRLIMQGVEATLISLKNDGHNGPVTTSLQEINDYKTRKAAE